MSTTRRQSAVKKRGPNGETLCSCGCGRPPGKGRRTWHSAECVERWKIANDPQHVRFLLWKRDHGVCCLCGVDSYRAELRAEVATVWGWSRKHQERFTSFHHRNGWTKPLPDFLRVPSARFGWASARVQRAIKNRQERMKRDGWKLSRRTSWWEADHILPVAEGGGQCGIENYRTLCVRCHAKETAALRRRLAEARKYG